MEQHSKKVNEHMQKKYRKKFSKTNYKTSHEWMPTIAFDFFFIFHVLLNKRIIKFIDNGSFCCYLVLFYFCMKTFTPWGHTIVSWSILCLFRCLQGIVFFNLICNSIIIASPAGVKIAFTSFILDTVFCTNLSFLFNC